MKVPGLTGSEVALERLASAIVGSCRTSLAKGITLIESSLPRHKLQAERLIELLSHRVSNREFHKKQSFVIGVAGPPGAGKSTFIEALGLKLVGESMSAMPEKLKVVDESKHGDKNDEHASDHKVAVISIDPSSPVSGGSILGDKTRMELLSRTPKAYIRTSPTRGVLGGIAEKTNDVLFLCASAGYDVCIVESVGVGQSEVEIDEVVDILLLVIPPGGGDDLQASKKGIMEAADLILVNKADGALLTLAKHTKADYQGTLKFVRPKHRDHTPAALMMSSKTGDGLGDVIKEIWKYKQVMTDNGGLMEKRLRQQKKCLWKVLERLAIDLIKNDENVVKESSNMEMKMAAGDVTPSMAAKRLFHSFERR